MGSTVLALAHESKLPSVHFGMADKLNIGVIGLGSRGAGLAAILSKVPSVRLVAMCDIQEEKARQVVGKLGIEARVYREYKELLEDKDIHAVVIATPHFLHASMAMDSLDANKHIYLEKSLSYNMQESIALVQKARANPNLIFQVGFQYRNYPLYHKVKEVLKNGWIGQVTHFESQYNRNSNWRMPLEDPKLERLVNWRMYREYCGGLLTELCAHPIDAINFITDSHPTKVVGMGSINYWKDGRDTYDNVRLVYEFENGVKSSVTSMLSNAYNGYSVRILGDKGTIEIDRDKIFVYAEGTNLLRGTVDGVTGATITNKTQGEREEIAFLNHGEQHEEPTITALNHFVACINDNKQPLSNVETGHITAVTLHMGNEAMDTETFQEWKDAYYV